MTPDQFAGVVILVCVCVIASLWIREGKRMG